MAAIGKRAWQHLLGHLPIAAIATLIQGRLQQVRAPVSTQPLGKNQRAVGTTQPQRLSHHPRVLEAGIVIAALPASGLPHDEAAGPTGQQAAEEIQVRRVRHAFPVEQFDHRQGDRPRGRHDEITAFLQFRKDIGQGQRQLAVEQLVFQRVVVQIDLRRRLDRRAQFLVRRVP